MPQIKTCRWRRLFHCPALVLRIDSACVKSKGTVYLVGAGLGDAGLLTLRGAELVGRADVVVYDALVNPELLRLAPESAEIIYGGKRARHADSPNRNPQLTPMPQAELNELLIAKARAG